MTSQHGSECNFVTNLKKRVNILLRQLSLNHCCCGKVISIRYSQCVSITLIIQQAMRMPAAPYFCININSKVFRRNVSEYKMRFGFFSTNFV